MHAIFYLKCYDDVVFEVRNWFLDSGLVSLNLNPEGPESRGGEKGEQVHTYLATCFSSGSEERSSEAPVSVEPGGTGPILHPCLLVALIPAADNFTDDPVGFLEPSFGDK